MHMQYISSRMNRLCALNAADPYYEDRRFPKFVDFEVPMKKISKQGSRDKHHLHQTYSHIQIPTVLNEKELFCHQDDGFTTVETH